MVKNSLNCCKQKLKKFRVKNKQEKLDKNSVKKKKRQNNKQDIGVQTKLKGRLLDIL
jgi:hypothetical protein